MVNLGFELERELSPATHLWNHRLEFPETAVSAAVLAGIQAGRALEACDWGGARRAWREVIAAARRAGREARCRKVTMRRFLAELGQAREAVETVLFDGRLPPDLAADAARRASKMWARVVEHGLAAYWRRTPARRRR